MPPLGSGGVPALPFHSWIKPYVCWLFYLPLTTLTILPLACCPICGISLLRPAYLHFFHCHTFLNAPLLALPSLFSGNMCHSACPSWTLFLLHVYACAYAGQLVFHFSPVVLPLPCLLHTCLLPSACCLHPPPWEDAITNHMPRNFKTYHARAVDEHCPAHTTMVRHACRTATACVAATTCL